MNYEDMINFMRDLGHFHSACWGEPVSAKPGLGPFRAHWQSLNDNYWSDDGMTTWDQVLPKWEEVYGQPLLSMVEPSVADTIKKIAEIYKSDQARQIQDALIAEMQTRPRTITHGDARGNNIFKSKHDGTVGIIDWQIDVLLDDLKLLFVNIWIEYLGFTLGSIDGYRDPNQQQAKDNFKELIKRAMETLHYSGCLRSFQAFIDRIN